MKPKIDYTISLGNLISLAAMLLLGFGAFYEVRAIAVNNSRDIEELSALSRENLRQITILRIGYGANLEKNAAIKEQVLSLRESFDAMELRLANLLRSRHPYQFPE